MKRRNWLVALAVVVVALPLAACGGSSPSDEGSGHEPAVMEAIEGSDLMKITLTEEAAARIAIETASVEDGQAGASVSIPYAAVLYDPDGATFTYTSPEPLVYVRAPITIDRIEGDVAYLTEGPATGTSVVTVGAAELFGTELGVDH